MPTSTITKIAFHGSFIHTALGVDGEPVVILKPTVEAMGLDWEPQRKKLDRRSWATTSQQEAVAADGKKRLMDACDLDTWSMLLANIDENRVSATAKPLVIAYQRESAQALRQYWAEGGAINPRATAEQLDALAVRTASQLEALGVAKKYGLVNDSYLEGVSRTLLARMTGEEPQLDPADITITCQEYLEDKGLKGKALRSARTRLGTAVAPLYLARHGKKPQKIKRLVDGVHHPVNVYTHRDLDLLDTAWAKVSHHYAKEVSR
ncbi:phage antirepressor N-terminal domain-containing protein [Nocardiopsis alba]|uniref:phage antirepressor N-terminal domain-containing protein n=1 Tax=Nocardiopsis alba TaxID=53437 RepID=UPI003672BCC1